MEHLDILQSQGESHCSFHIIHLLRKKASHTTRHCSVQKNLFTSHSSNFSHPPFMPLLPLQSLLLCVLHPVTVVCFSFRIMDFCSYRSLTSRLFVKQMRIHSFAPLSFYVCSIFIPCVIFSHYPLSFVTSNARFLPFFTSSYQQSNLSSLLSH